MTHKETTSTFVTLINNNPVHRVDLTHDGKKNTRDYAYGLAHYSIGQKFKAEVQFTDKTETVISGVVIKNKTFNTVVAEFKKADCIGAIVHALDNRVMATRMFSAKALQTKAKLNKLANTL